MIKNIFHFIMFLPRVSQGKSVLTEVLRKSCFQNVPRTLAICYQITEHHCLREQMKWDADAPPKAQPRASNRASDSVGNGEMHERIFLAVYIHTYISLRLKRNLLNITIWNVLKEQISSLRQTSQRQEWTKHRDGRCWEHLKWDHAELFTSHYQASGPGSWLGLPYILSLRMYGILAYHPQLRIPTSLGTRWIVIWVLKGTSWDE